MRFRSRLGTPSDRTWQRRVIWLCGGLGICVLSLQLLARGVVPALLTNDSERSNDVTSNRWRPDVADLETSDSDGQSPNVRVASDQQQRVFTNAKRERGTSQQQTVFESSRWNRNLQPPEDMTISPELLAAIKDNSVGIRDAERDVYALLLRRMTKASDRDLASAAKTISYSVVMADSKRLIGSIIRVKGEVRRIVALPHSPDSTLPQLYEAWLFNEDSGRNPYRIVFMDRSELLPIADELKPVLRVEATGYYFKRYGYATVDARLHVAPMIVAKTLKLERRSTR